MNIPALAQKLLQGERKAIVQALNLVDNHKEDAQAAVMQLFSVLPEYKLMHSGHIIGFTGPPGAGKSSVIAALLQNWRSQGKKVAVLAVDPSSAKTGGALLGDRIRMLQKERDEGVFIRSLASRGQLGGVSVEVWPMSQILLCCFDVVVVETVGVGQNEVDIAQLVDTTCFIVQPSSGDTIQFMKAGIFEIPDILVVNKSDLGLVAQQVMQDLHHVLHAFQSKSAWKIPVCSISAKEKSGMEQLGQHLEEHRHFLFSCGGIEENRRLHQVQWSIRQLKDEFGWRGLQHFGGQKKLQEDWMLRKSALQESLAYYSGLKNKLLTSAIWQN